MVLDSDCFLWAHSLANAKREVGYPVRVDFFLGGHGRCLDALRLMHLLLWGVDGIVSMLSSAGCPQGLWMVHSIARRTLLAATALRREQVVRKEGSYSSGASTAQGAGLVKGSGFFSFIVLE